MAETRTVVIDEKAVQRAEDVIHGFNELSGHAKRGFCDLEFALACVRDNATMMDGGDQFADGEEDGNGDSQWAMFHAGCEFFRQVAQSFVDKKEPDYKAVYNEVIEQLMYSIKRRKYQNG